MHPHRTFAHPWITRRIERYDFDVVSEFREHG
jgi:hypothetical protein